MSDGLRWTAQGGAFGFALGLMLALGFGAAPETALYRALLTGIGVSGTSLLASYLNRRTSMADERKVTFDESRE